MWSVEFTASFPKSGVPEPCQARLTGGTKKRSGIEGESTKQRGADRGLGANGCHDARRISIRPPLSPWTCFDCNGDSRG